MKISPKKLIKMARKWQKIASLSKRRISIHRVTNDTNYHHVDTCNESCTTLLSSSSYSSVVDKGHFVVYTTDERRFVMPLAYLKHSILRELFRLSEEEYGLSSDGPITLPCNAAFMEYVVTLLRQGVPKDVEKALLRSIDKTCGYSSLVSSSFQYQGPATLHFLVCGYHHKLMPYVSD